MIEIFEFKFKRFLSLDDSPLFEHDADRSKKSRSSQIQLHSIIYFSTVIYFVLGICTFSVESVRQIAAINRTHDVPFNRRWTKILTRFLLSSSKKHK